jgi:3-isopropylmalate dehydratase small subunit
LKKISCFGIVFVALVIFSASATFVCGRDEPAEHWFRRYNGLGNYDDYAYAIAVDNEGNVYVTGQSDGDGTSRDYATVAYDNSGNELWIKRYDGPGNYDDYAYAIAVDTAGNVYVTGQSDGIGTYGDYATVAYDSSGNELWIKRYNGSGNYDDIARAIAVDTAGNVYVTGSSYESGTYYDYTTVAYDNSGNELWIKKYDGPGNLTDFVRAMAVDAEGNVYVTGKSTGVGTSYDYATVAYDSSGNELWVKRYNGPGNSYDIAYAIAVDSEGNICVTGDSYGIGTSYDYATVAYDSSGNEFWVARYDGPGNSYDIAYAIAVDSEGNVYVTGSSYGIETSYDYATVAYDSSGNELWVNSYNSPGNYDDYAYAIAVDTERNVYVTGDSYGIETSYDYATVAYDSSGNELWVKRYNGPENNQDIAWDIAVDTAGNVYVTGNSYGIGTSNDYGTIKYSQYTLTPTEAIEDLIRFVEDLNLQKNIKNNLSTKLDAALKALKDENESNDVVAINALGAFINAVKAQQGKKISEADADILIETAQGLIAMLSDM